MLTDEDFNEWMLRGLEKEWAGCQRCTLADGRGRMVFGEGVPFPDLVIVGGAPGSREDLKGRPFCGEAGILLRRVLKMLELARGKTHLLSSVMCHPVNDRTPRDSELEACRPRLIQHISVLRPRVILLLGAVAASWVDYEATGRVDRQDWPEFDLHGRARLEAMFVGLDPADVLNKPDKGSRRTAFRQFLADLTRVKRRLET